MTTKFISNWRFNIVMLFVVISIPFIACEADRLIVFCVAKFIGIIMISCAALLFKYWEGFMDDIKNIEE